MCDFEIEDLASADECQKEGGMKVKFHYALAKDVETVPEPDPLAATYAESVTVTTDFVMKTGKYFREAEGEMEQLQLMSESQGELGSLSAKNDYNFLYRGTSKQMVGFLNAVKNAYLYLIVEDLHGNKRMLGQVGLPAKISSFSEDSGKAVADAKGIAFTVYAPGKLPYFYEGAIPVEVIP